MPNAIRKYEFRRSAPTAGLGPTALLVLASTGACRVISLDVGIQFQQNSFGDPLPLACSVDAGAAGLEPLTNRALPARELFVVVDHFRVPDFPPNPNEPPPCDRCVWTDTCDAACCEPPLTRRECFRVDLLTATMVRDGAPADPQSIRQFVASYLRRSAPPWEAPDGRVLVRAVATTEPCTTFADASVPATFARERLVGCGLSSPVELRAAQAEPIPLRLPGAQPDRDCEAVVYRCATLFHRDFLTGRCATGSGP
jgi:hypothetical protein